MHAARLSALLKSLASAEGAVSESIKARRALIAGLEKILETNKAALAGEETQHAKFSSRKGIIEAKKREVEDGIMRGLSAESSPVSTHATLGTDAKLHINGKASSQTHNNSSAEQIERHIEEPTPPPIETLTPVGSPIHQTFYPNSPDATNPNSQSTSNQAPIPNQTPAITLPSSSADLLSTLAMPPARHYAGSPGSAGVGGNAFKKRKLEADFSGFGAPGGDAMADLDDDVAELLRAEGGGWIFIQTLFLLLLFVFSFFLSFFSFIYVPLPPFSKKGGRCSYVSHVNGKFWGRVTRLINRVQIYSMFGQS